MDRRTLPGLIAAVLAALLGAGGAVARLAPVGLAGAAAALLAAVWIGWPRRRPDVAPSGPVVASMPPPILDVDTGLPEHEVFAILLESRVAAARRRLWPLALVMIEIHPRRAVGLFTVLLRQTIREADTACRTGPTTFAVLLEDTGEAGGVWAAERIQIAVAKEREADSAGTDIRVAAGVASYPNHALKADQLTLAAESALARAKGQRPPHHGLGAVEVARADLG